MKNMFAATKHIAEQDEFQIQYILFCLLQDCLYTGASSPFMCKHYDMMHSDEKYKKKYELIREKHGLLDHELVQLNRKRLINALEDLITGGGKKKFTDVIKQINFSMHGGFY
jgi:hypothetical protein